MILLQLVRALNFDLHFSNVRTNALQVQAYEPRLCFALLFFFPLML